MVSKSRLASYIRTRVKESLQKRAGHVDPYQKAYWVKRKMEVYLETTPNLSEQEMKEIERERLYLSRKMDAHFKASTGLRDTLAELERSFAFISRPVGGMDAEYPKDL